MRAFAVLCGLALFLGAMAGGDNRAWTAYQDKEAGYRVSFPGRPTTGREKCRFNGKPAISTSASFTQDGATVAVNTVVTQDRVTGSEEFFADVKSLMTRGGEAQLSESSDLKVAGAPAKHMVSMTRDGSARIETFSFLRGHCGYVVMAICPNLPGRYEAMRKHFFSSFDLLGK